jgi:hypothetical protein
LVNGGSRTKTLANALFFRERIGHGFLSVDVNDEVKNVVSIRPSMHPCGHMSSFGGAPLHATGRQQLAHCTQASDQTSALCSRFREHGKEVSSDCFPVFAAKYRFFGTEAVASGSSLH